MVETAASIRLDGATDSAKGPEAPADEPEQTWTTGLESPRPNPSNPSTEIRFSLAKEGVVRLVIYNQRGEKVWELPEQLHPAGEHVVHWRGRDTSGHW